VSDQKNKPALDEQAFEKLLEAAFVIQEHNRGMRDIEESLELHSEQLRQQEAATQAASQGNATGREEKPRANGDYTLTLAEIVEAQHQIQMYHLESEKALAVVVERITRITNASGAAVGILEGKTIRYRAGAGASALPLGSEVPLEAAICAASVRTGQVLRTQDVNTEFMFDPDLCRKRGIQSLVTVPIYQDGNIVGALELYFNQVSGFVEQDIHTCQLMAGLVTETIGREAESALKKSMAAERSSMLAAMEKLKPNLPALAEHESPAIAGGNPGANAVGTGEGSLCWKCGAGLVGEEQFCGKCGAPRVGDSDHSSTQSKLASAWHMQQATQENSRSVPLNGTSREPEASRLGAARNRVSAPSAAETEASLLQPHPLPKVHEDNLGLPQAIAASGDEEAIQSLSPKSQVEGNELEASSTALLKPQPHDVTWSSAAKAREVLEALAGTRSPGTFGRFWRARRGDFYLAFAVILVAVVIRWGMLSSHPVGATGRASTASGSTNRRNPSPDADLSTFDKLLISLGLAEAPETPEYKGNPATQVWVDLHTALYYCPGSDLYGKTPKGKFASQRDAQLDQFEPAYRKTCD